MKKISKKVLSIFLALIMMVSILPAGIITAYADVNHTQDEALKWIKSQKRVSLDYDEVPPDDPYQCVDLIYYYLDYLNSKSLIGGNASAYVTKELNSNWTRVKSNYEPGDIAVWPATESHYDKCTKCGSVYNTSENKCNNKKCTNKKYKRIYTGHVGIIYSVNKDGSLNVYQQNYDGIKYVVPKKVQPSKLACGLRPSFKSVKPSAPKITSNVSGDVATGSNVTITWSKISNATGYIVKVNGSQVQKNSSNKYAFKADKAKKYEITVIAYNSAGNSNTSNKITITAKNPSTVTFKDYDGTVLNTQTVKYGSAAISPTTPLREGYTFDGWDGAYNNVTSNLTVTATYKINTYTIKFVDKDGKILSTQKVEYLNDATPPDSTNTPIGCEFLGWDSAEYLSVKNDATIQAIYSWSNSDLPIIAEITSAIRQDDGYYVYFDLTNYPDDVTRGRAVVSLKTAEGKLIDTTESTAFSIPKNGTKTGMEVFIPCEKTATNAEVVIVNSYSSGVPISETASSIIDQGKSWSEWSTEKPDENIYDFVESRTEYRCRDKETSKANTRSMDGWIWDETYYSVTGNWSSWSWNQINPYSNESVTREVQTQEAVKSTTSKTYYKYFRYSSSKHALWGNYYKNSSYPNIYRIQTNSALTYKGTDADTSKSSNAKYYYQKCSCSNGYHYWYSDNGNLGSNGKVTETIENKATQYRYRDTVYTYNFYRWKDWSDWTDKAIEANSNREIETRTVYRYKSNDVGTEDTNGEIRTVSGKLDSAFAGKQAALFVYKVDEASDYSNEYVAQTKISEDGSYSFTFKLREEPTVKTGDFTIALGIEGTTNTTIIGTIEAPKPVYTVNFYDYQGNVIDTQQITQGDNAVVPTLDEREGYTFTGWSDRTTNIKDNLDIHPEYTKNKYTVVFVNWETDSIDVKEFYYGEPLIAPDEEPKEGYNLTGWEGFEDGKTTVTDNMIVTAVYEKEIYNVNFFDFDGNVISTQNVAYGEAAQTPEDLEADNVIFLGWSSENNDDYTEVKCSMDLYPQYIFEETTANPTADIKTGVYNDRQTVALSCDTEASVIYYTVDGSNPAEKGILYTEPIEISHTCHLRFIASAFEMNDSLEVSEYYCINNPNIPSEWFSYSELPQNVIDNINSYTMETDIGYRYKEIQRTSDISIANQLRANGWLYEESTYTDYTAWQDEAITDDASKPGFEIDTREVDDTTVTRYQYSHYKYTDSNGDIQYSPSDVDGYDCEYETIILENRLTIAGFGDNNTSYYTYNGERWFTQTKVNGVKTQYRSRYQIDKYYKWTAWTIDAPSSSESREYITDNVYRYYNKNHFIINIPNLSQNTTILLIRENQTIDMSEYDNVSGYSFVGLYFDELFTQKFDLSTPVTESLTLYAKYSPKLYTVTFQMQDGTELDTQTVEYMGEATAPLTDVVPEYVFGGWDKEFDCITEDTVITGKYFKTSEYTMVYLDKANATLFDGSSIQLNLTITPSDLADEEVEWTSSNPSVVSVNETGLVTAVGAGVATISVRAVKTNHTATCTITVLADQSNTIVLSTNSYLNYDELGYLRRIAHGSTVNEIMSQFQNSSLDFLGLNGEKLSPTDKVGTGTRINLCKDGEIIDTNTVIVTADMTGDGIISNRDVVMFNKYQVQKITPEECQVLAMDVNGDGYVNNKDAAMVARYLVGKETL